MTRSNLASLPDNPTELHHEHGFTLVELLVVLAILGLLVAIAAPQVMRQLGGAKSETAGIQIEKLGGVLDLYRLEVGAYPTSSEGLNALVDRPVSVPTWNGPYLKNSASLIDPWGRPYQYRSPGDHGTYDLWTLGADGKPGGDGENRDVSSWSDPRRG
jgi:general secretion pathway protein G